MKTIKRKPIAAYPAEPERKQNNAIFRSGTTALAVVEKQTPDFENLLSKTFRITILFAIVCGIGILAGIKWLSSVTFCLALVSGLVVCLLQPAKMLQDQKNIEHMLERYTRN